MAQTGDRPRLVVVALALGLAASALLVLRQVFAPDASEISQLSLETDPGRVGPTVEGAGPVSLVSGARRAADAPTRAQGPSAEAVGGTPAVVPSAASVTHDATRSSERLVTLDVVQARGVPVPLAKVRVERLLFHPSAAPRAFDVLELTADERGRVRFDRLGELRGDLAALEAQLGVACTATDGAGNASPELVLEPPVEPGPHLLVLAAAAAVTIEVVEGSPALAVAGADVHLDRVGRDSDHPVRATTDTRGLARLDGLAPGEWSYYVQPEGAEHNVRGTVELAPGEDRTLIVTLDEGEEALAVAGRFVDEEGAPIEVGRDDHPKLWVGADLTDFGLATAPDADGKFRVYLPRSAEVVVRNFGGHRYEPEVARVPFGTQDLVLRRLERFDSRTVSVEVRDGADGALLNEAQLTVYDHDARTANGMSLVRRRGPGRLETTLLARPGTRLVLWADAYAPRFMDLPRSGATADAPFVVHLERGGLRELYLLDAATLQPLEGVELVAEDGATVATTDAAGRAAVRVDHVGWLSLRRAGFASERFHPTWPWDRAYLTRE
jgi:hypothetical protein